MRHIVNGRTQNLFSSERRYLMKNKIHTLESDHSVLAGTKRFGKRQRTKLIIFKQRLRKQSKAVGFVEVTLGKQATCSVETLAEVSPLHCEITRPQPTISSPAWEYVQVCVWLHSPLCRATCTGSEDKQGLYLAHCLFVNQGVLGLLLSRGSTFS